MQRRALVSSLATAVLLPGCGFHLRQPPNYAFKSIYLQIAPNSPLGAELRRYLKTSDQITVLTDGADRDKADVILQLLQDQRERVVLSYNSTGQVLGFQLRVRVRFSLFRPGGREIIEPTELLLQQDQSYDETLALAKEQEAQLIYRNLQSDAVQQIIRRLSVIRDI